MNLKSGPTSFFLLWAIIILIFVLLAPPFERRANLASAELLTRLFEKAAFNSVVDATEEGPEWRVTKRLTKHIIHTSKSLDAYVLSKNNPKYYSGRFYDIITDISNLISYRVELNEDISPDDPRTILTKNSFEKLVESYPSFRKFEKEGRSFFDRNCRVWLFTNGSPKLLDSVLILISPKANDEYTNRCIRQGIFIGIGLSGEGSNSVVDSLIMPLGKKFDYLTLNDKIIIRTLYDPRIKPGMAKAEAMGLARVIIPELVAAVKKDGEAALYQKER
jgi:hypothetical protein